MTPNEANWPTGSPANWSDKKMGLLELFGLHASYAALRLINSDQ
jgi:hypothetical protein